MFGVASRPRSLLAWLVSVALLPIMVPAALVLTATAAHATDPYATAVLADSPTSYWRLGETSGSTAHDEQSVADGSYRGGVIGGLSGVTPGNTAVFVDGTSGAMDAHSTSFATPSFSWEVWVRTTAPDGDIISGNWDGTTLPAYGATSWLSISDGYPTLIAEADTGSGPHLSGSSLIDDGQWHQLVVTSQYASGSSTTHLYVDGSDVGSATTNPVTNSGEGLSLGYVPGVSAACVGDCGGPLRGAADELAVYGSALSSARVAAHYAAADLSLQGGPITAAERRGFSNVGSRWICSCSVPAADPVDPATGNFSETFSDVTIAGRGPGIDWSRSYNSDPGTTLSDGPFGYGWSPAYAASISVVSGTATVTEENGATLTFTSSGGAWTAPPRVTSTLVDNGTTWTLTRNKRDILTFDKTTGHLDEIDDLNGYHTTFSYDGSGHLITVTDNAGRTLSVAWTGSHITSVTDFTGRTVSYQYNDGNNNLTDVIDVRGGHWQFSYDTNHRMQTMRSPRYYGDTTTSPTPVTTNVYDSSGRVTSQTDPIGRQTTFDYTTLASSGGVIVTDPNGFKSVAYYDSNGLLVKETRGYGTGYEASWTYAYDPYTLGRIATVDPLGHTTQTAYDASGNVIATSDGLGRTTFYTYDSLNDVLTRTDPKGITTAYSYDTGGHGDLTQVSTPCKNPDGSDCTTTPQITQYAHTDGSHPGDVTSMTDPRSKVTTYGYDGDGNLNSVTDALSDQTTYTYDRLGRQVSVVDARGNVSGGNPDLWRTASLHDNAGNTTLTVNALGVPDIDSFTRADASSSLGNTETGKNWQTPAGTWGVASGTAKLASSAGATNLAVALTSANGTVAITEPTVQTGTGIAFRESDTSNFWTLRADSTNNTWDLIKTVAGTSTTVATTGASTCCTNGQRPTVTFKNSTITISVSGSTPVVATDSALSSNSKAGIFAGATGSGRFDDFVFYKTTAGFTSATYDADGNTATSTDGDGNTTSNVYDPAEQLTTVNRADTTQLSYTYDGDGNELTYKDGRNKTTTYTYNDAAFTSSTTTVKPPVVSSAQITHYTYDRAGNRGTMTDPSTRETDYGYDAANELTSVAFNSATMTDVGYSYDADGQRTGKTGGDTGTEAWTYDSLHRLRSSSLGLSTGTVNYGYDLDNNLTSISYPSVGTVTRTYDDAERLSTVADWQSPTNTTTYSYNEDSTPNVVTYPNGVTSTTTYDNAQEPTEIKIAKSGTTLADFAYSYSAGGLLDSETPTGLGSSQTYNYDALNHLTKANTAVYSYDNGDNMTKLAGTIHQAFDQANELCWSGTTSGSGCTTTPTGNASYGYDAQGNRTTLTPASGSGTTYGYNQLNQLTQQGVTGAGSPTTTYLYDADGLRIRKTAVSTSTNTDYIWDTADSPQPLLQETTSGTTTNYIYGLDGAPIEQVVGTTTTYLHQDQLGSTRVITNAAGSVVGTLTYDPYGALASGGHTGTADSNLQYDGQYLDSETGFYYLRARYYDPSTGQLLSEDPMAAATHESYGYAFDTPLNAADPSGQFCGGPFCGVVHTLGGVGSCLAGIMTCLSEGYKAAHGDQTPEAGGSPMTGSGSDAFSQADPYVSVWVQLSLAEGLPVGVLEDTCPLADRLILDETGAVGGYGKSETPSWVFNEGYRALEGEKPVDAATRIMNKQYGEGNWEKGPGTEFNRIVKWVSRTQR